MEQAVKQVENIINRLCDLHKRHLAAFETDTLPDLEVQSMERRMAVDQLMKHVSSLIKMAESGHEPDTASMLQRLNHQVTGLLEQNRAIENKVVSVKARIQKKMRQVSKGSKMIRSYRSSDAGSNSPKVISVTK